MCSRPAAAETFAAIVVGEILWGLVVGWLMLRLRRFVGDPRIEITLSLLTPYLAYWPPEYLGGSGVLATVVTGLYISWNGLRLISAATRLQGIFFWDLLIYLIEGLVFLVTGLQARALARSLRSYSTHDLAMSALVVCAVVIVARFVWMFPATYVPRWLSASLARRDPSPPWQFPFLLAFTGVRGIVSLAAALAIPLTIADGSAFPERDLILFLTFVVILVTLVGQGLLLPAVIRWLGLANAGLQEHEADRVQEFVARREAVQASLARLDEIEKDERLELDLLERLRAQHRERLRRVDHRGQVTASIGRRKPARRDRVQPDRSGTPARERALSARRAQDEARRRIEREIDLREAQLVSWRGEER